MCRVRIILILRSKYLRRLSYTGGSGGEVARPGGEGGGADGIVVAPDVLPPTEGGCVRFFGSPVMFRMSSVTRTLDSSRGVGTSRTER